MNELYVISVEIIQVLPLLLGEMKKNQNLLHIWSAPNDHMLTTKADHTMSLTLIIVLKFEYPSKASFLIHLHLTKKLRDEQIIWRISRFNSGIKYMHNFFMCDFFISKNRIRFSETCRFWENQNVGPIPWEFDSEI